MNHFKTPLNPEWHKVVEASNFKGYLWEIHYQDSDSKEVTLDVIERKNHQFQILVVTDEATTDNFFEANNEEHALAIVEQLHPELRIQWAWPTPDFIPHKFSFDFNGELNILAVESGVVVNTNLLETEAGHIYFTTVKGRTGKIVYICNKVSFTLGDTITIGQPMGKSMYGPSSISSKDFDIIPYLRAAWSRVTHTFHKSLEPIPTDPAEKKKMIQWLDNHDLWTHEAHVKMPPEGESLFERMEGSSFFVMKKDRDDWEDHTYREGSIQECAQFDHVYVCPWNDRIMNDDSLNTAFRIWVEAGGWSDMSEDEDIPEPDKGWNEHNKWIGCRFLGLETGGQDMQEALLHLARNVKYWFGDSDEVRESAIESCELIKFEDDFYHPCEDDGTGFCKKCGHLIRYRWYDPKD